MSKDVEQTRTFKMHSKLLFDVIEQQAGSLEKAILEGGMNSIDAGASQCRITVDDRYILISDNGSGIDSMESIEKFFETFGQPHSDAEGKTFGKFRMGRGQMFAYGVNSWRTGEFAMEVDIKNRGLDYTLRRQKVHPGCDIRIDLYSPLGRVGVHDTVKNLEAWLKYVDPDRISIIVNGNVVNTGLKTEKWDHVTDEAYIKLSDRQTLLLYNLGVHTMDLGAYRFGSGGVVVTRQQIKVNFARNDVMSSCPVWTKIKPFLAKKATERISSTPRLSEQQRIKVLQDFGRDKGYSGIYRMSVFRSVYGRPIPTNRIAGMADKCHNVVSFAGEGDLIADRLIQSGVALVLSKDSLLHTGLSEEALVVALNQSGITRRAQHIPFDQLKGELSESFTLLDDKDLSGTEAVWLDLARRAGSSVYRSLERYDSNRRLSFSIGISDCANGWTDGRSYVAIDRRFLSSLDLDTDGFIRLGRLVLHELCHHESSAASHSHDENFYKEFHDLSGSAISNFVSECEKSLETALNLIGKRLTRAQMALADKKEAASERAKKILATAKAVKAEPTQIAAETVAVPVPKRVTRPVSTSPKLFEEGLTSRRTKVVKK